jgi:hypothetical protein
MDLYAILAHRGRGAAMHQHNCRYAQQSIYNSIMLESILSMNLQHLDCGFTSNVDKLTLSFCQVSLPAIRPKDSNQHPIAYLASKEQ